MAKTKIKDLDFTVSLTLPSMNKAIRNWVSGKDVQVGMYVGRNPVTLRVENWLIPYVIRQCDEGGNENNIENMEIILTVNSIGFSSVVRSWNINTLSVINATTKRSKIENPVRAFLWVLSIIVYQILDEAFWIMFRGSSGINKEWKDMRKEKAKELQYN